MTITPEQENTVREAWKKYRQQISGRAPLEIAAGGLEGLKQATPVKRELDGGLGYSAAAAYDDKNLYVRYQVKSPAKLVNLIPDPQVIFKGGNLLDIQLAANPQAVSGRKAPEVGDTRLLIPRQNGQTQAVVFRPKLAKGDGKPIRLESPTGSETFASIEVSPEVTLRDYQETPEGFTVTAQIPLSVLGWKPVPGQSVTMDLGYVFGNREGALTIARAYWANNSFTANVLNDIPHESRLEPAEWGKAQVK